MKFDFSWDNVVSGRGIEISLTGMFIVFSALVLISLYIALVPRILAVLAPILPPEKEHSPAAAPAAKRPDDVPESELLAAIGYAFHCEQQTKS